MKNPLLFALMILALLPLGPAFSAGRTTAAPRLSGPDTALQLELESYAVAEDAGSVAIRVIRHDDTTPVSVDYATADGTAKAGVDYLAAAGTLVFGPGETLKSIAVTLVNDHAAEPTKSFGISLRNPAGGASLGHPTAATVAITDDDETIQFGAATYHVREDAAFARIGLVRGENDSAATVTFAATDGTATAGLDYVAATNTVRFAAGERLKFVDVPLLDDGIKEADETIRLALENPTSGALLGNRRTATITIIDDDPGIGFAESTRTAWQNWDSVTVGILRGNSRSLGPVRVDYATMDGSARAGIDYTAISGTLEFAGNETVRSLVVPLLRTPGVGGEKVFSIVLTNPAGAIPLGNAVAVFTIRNAAPGTSRPVLPRLDADARLAAESGATVLTPAKPGMLQRSDHFDGPWEDLAGVTTPMVGGTVLPARFYRIQSPRPTRVYVPSGYDGHTAMPLVVLLHAYQGKAVWMESYFAFQPAAESRGLLLCYPEGTPDIQGLNYWNATEACCDFHAGGEDDSGYLRAVIEEIARRFAVDRKRIYVGGISNGGFMAHRMACEHADLIAGIASFAGATYLDADRHRPSEPVNILQIHGTSDEIVPYAGGALVGLPVQALFPGAAQTVAIWARINGCSDPSTDPGPSMDLVLDVAGPETIRTRYAACPPGGSVELWTINGGIHLPVLSGEFPGRVVDWLLAHPKP
ncbi:MAG: hypothetical protein DVB31_04815 [Verrucomicrobia bacterium]|nr:MAG: hypothetical protein DVB31_04815 [Verrucomicrobiota bacterium]